MSRRGMLAGCAAPAFLALVAGSANAQISVEGPYRLHSVLDSHGADLFGASVASAGDVDRDGFDDVLVGAPGADPGGLINAGSVFLFSGKGGFLLGRFDGLAAADEFGFWVDGNSDVDNDGVPDVLVGAPGSRVGGVPNTGRVYVISGATFEIIREYPGRKAGGRFGHRVVLPGDLDGDGHGDVAASAPLANIGTRVAAGKVFVINGRTPRILFTIRGLIAGEQVGWSMGKAGDSNGDGRSDIVVGAPGCSSAGRPRSGCVLVYSGASGLLLSRIDGEAAEQNLGRSVGFVPDLDDDGVPEIIVGTSSTQAAAVPEAGAAILFSGRTGVPLFRYLGGAEQQRAGFAVAAAGDVDGDGHADIVIGSPSTDALPGTAKAEIYMFNDLQLDLSGTPRLGSTFSLHLTAGPGDSYIVLFSPRGGPGSRYTPVPFPVGPGNATAIDVGLEYWRFSLANPPLAGIMPRSGELEIPLNVPQRPRYENARFHAQFITFPGASASIDKISNAVTFVVLPAE